MHIAFMTPGFVENNGPTTGFPKYLLRVSKALIKFGHKVSIITCSNRSVYYEFLGIQVYRVRRPAIKVYGEQKTDIIAGCLRDGYILKLKLEEIFKTETIDIVQYTSLCGLAYFHDLPVPAVTRLSSYAKMLPLNSNVKEAYGKMERAAAMKCNGVFAPSQIVAKALSKDIEKEVTVIESPYVMDDKEKLTVFRKYFQGKKYILFYGTLSENKGVNVIAKGIYQILDKHTDLFVGIIGDGDKRLVDLIMNNSMQYADRVIYHAAIGFAELQPIIRNAKAVMLPSLMENLSNACIECMALGQIVIGTKGASFEQLIDDEESGFLCKIGDYVSLNRAIDKVLNLSEEKVTKIQEKAKERAELLSPNIVVKQLIEYYEQIIVNYNQIDKDSGI